MRKSNPLLWLVLGVLLVAVVAAAPTGSANHYFDGPAKFLGSWVAVQYDLWIGDDLEVTDDAAVGGDLTVTGDASIGDSLAVTGNLTSAGVVRGIALGGVSVDTLVFSAATTDTLAWSGVTVTDKVAVTAIGDPGGYFYAEVLADQVAIHAEASNSAEYVILLLRR